MKGLIDHHACRKILQLRVTAGPGQFQQIVKEDLMRIDPSFQSVLYEYLRIKRTLETETWSFKDPKAKP